MSRPLKVQIAERARDLIADEQHWCRRHLALDANGVVVSPTSARAVKRCGLGAVIAAAYQLTHDYITNFATRLWAHDSRGRAAVLALFDEVIAAG